MSPYDRARCEMPGKPCPRLATVDFIGRRFCALCHASLTRMGMDDRRPVPVTIFRGTAA